MLPLQQVCINWQGLARQQMYGLCREARMDQKVARREAARDREASPEMTKLPGGGDVMGGDDSLAAAKARYAMITLSAGP